MNEADAQVAILGGGPVGLFAALRLSHLGVSCQLFEAEQELPEDLRASTFHPPTLELLDQFGLTEPLLAQGRICPTWQVRLHPSHERAEFDLSLLKADTCHPYRLQCEQFRLCRLLLRELRGRGNVQLRFGHRVTDLRQDGERVHLDVQSAGGARRFQAPFAIGADGAHSIARRCLGLSFEGRTYLETTILATTSFPFEEHLPGLSGINYVWHEQGGTFSLLHLPQIWRCSLYPDEGESLEEAVAPAAIQRKLQGIVPRSEPYEVLAVRPYRIHMRIVNRYRKGRVALAGDAAHLNSPSGGMGMNGGLQDAWLLAETLGEIAAGAPLELLDRYSRRRRPVALEQILKQADANRRRMQERDPAKRRELFEELRRIAGNRERARRHLLRSSMISGWRQSLEAA